MLKNNSRQSFQDQLRQKKRKKKERKILLWGFFLIIWVSVLIYSLFFSSYFVIQKISVDGTDLVSADEVKNITSEMLNRKEWIIFNTNNLFFYPIQDAQNAIQKAFPPIAQVSIIRHFNPIRVGSWIKESELTVHVVERDKIALACDDVRCFFVDDNGIVFASAPMTYGASVMRISETDLSKTVLPDSKYSKEFIAFIKGVKITSINDSIIFDSFSRLNDYGDIQAHTADNYTVFFTMSQDAKKQVRILKEILSKMVQGDIAKLEYVNLRVENRAYYKLRE